MRKIIGAILLIGFLSLSALAQRVEIFGGAQIEHIQSSYNAVMLPDRSFKHVLGITGDFSGVYKSHPASSCVHTYTVGPVLTA